MPEHFLDINDHDPAWLAAVLERGTALKAKNEPELLRGKTLAMVFEKPSLRTRVSFETGMLQLGGHALNIRPDEVGLGKREPAKDVARVLSGMVDGVMARLFDHATLRELADFATVPVINGLTDYNHPCQALADVMTIQEHFGKLDGLTVAWVGDGNNVARSMASACHALGMRFVCATPPGYELPTGDVGFTSTHDPVEAVREADVVYTDTWISMGQEAEKAERVREFGAFCVDEALLDKAPKHAVVLHCLPAYRGLEISDTVMESDRCLAFPQAHNRLHAQKGVLATLLG
ncbi:MAG: ornithine carbamoyltransferase [Planctomycetota bacterium]